MGFGIALSGGFPCGFCKTRENFNFLKKGKMVISAKNWNFTFFEATRVTCDMR